MIAFRQKNLFNGFYIHSLGSPLQNGVPPKISSKQKVAEPFSEDQRKLIFLEAIEAEKRGIAEANRQYANDGGLNITLKQQLTTKYRRDV